MNNKELMFSLTKKDFEVSYFSGSGGGGQNRNRHQNCVRIRHPESGVIATGQDQKSKEQNRKNAFRRLFENPKFKIWLNKKINDCLVDEKSLNEKVDDLMKPENLKVEYLT